MAEENRIEELKKMIEESNQKIKQKNLSIDQINKELELKKEEVKTAEDRAAKLAPVKIFTKKERDELEKENAQKSLKKLTEERLNIESDTKKALEKAQQIREDAKNGSENEQKSADISALKVETEALGKKVKILTDILHEKESSMEDLLAQKAVEESAITKYKLEINSAQSHASKNSEMLSQLRDKMADVRNKKNNTYNLYLKIKKEAEDTDAKCCKAERKFQECFKKLKSYGDF